MEGKSDVQVARGMETCNLNVKHRIKAKESLLRAAGEEKSGKMSSTTASPGDGIAAECGTWGGVRRPAADLRPGGGCRYPPPGLAGQT